MKKLFFVAAMATMALSSCSKNEIDSGSITTQSNDAIGFSTFVGINTKGAITDLSSIQTDGFGVMGYYHPATDNYGTAGVFSSASTPDFMYNQKVTYSSNQWVYSPVKYWPNNEYDRISFFGYAPYDSGNSLNGTANADGTGVVVGQNTTTSRPNITFTIADDPEDLVDLVADMQYEVAKNSDYSSADEDVSFNFQHILTRANFKVALADDIVSTSNDQEADNGGNSNTYVYVTDLQLVGSGNSTGIEILYDKGGSARDSKNFYAKGLYTITTPTNYANELGDWAVGGYTYQTDNYSLITSNFFAGSVNVSSSNNTGWPRQDDSSRSVIGKYTSAKDYRYHPTNWLRVTGGLTDSSGVIDPNNLFKDDQYLFLIPPVNDGEAVTTDDESVLVYIEYDVVTLDAGLTAGYSLVTNRAIVALSGLKEAVAYEYTFYLGLSSVKVDADVTEWLDDWADADVETDEATTQTDITEVAIDNAGLTTAINNLNTIAATSVQRTFYVDASDVALTGTKTLSLTGDINFKAGDTIEFTLKNESSTAYLTITGTGLTFTGVVSGNTVTFTVSATIQA